MYDIYLVGGYSKKLTSKDTKHNYNKRRTNDDDDEVNQLQYSF